jgi:hypothetical protein
LTEEERQQIWAAEAHRHMPPRARPGCGN